MLGDVVQNLVEVKQPTVKMAVRFEEVEANQINYTVLHQVESYKSAPMADPVMSTSTNRRV